MKTCDLCGASASEFARECPVCGNPFRQAVTPISERLGFVCDRCDAWNPEGSEVCSLCGERLVELSPRSVAAQNAVQVIDAVDARSPPYQAALNGSRTPTPTTVGCAICGTMIILEHKFCSKCGASRPPILAVAAPRSTAAAPIYTMILIGPDGGDSHRFSMSSDAVVCGRNAGRMMFPDDRLLSPRHAAFRIVDGAVEVDDLDSLNGVFVRIRHPVPLLDSDTLMIGEQMLIFRGAPAADPPIPARDGTLPYTSVTAPAHFRLVQVLYGGRVGAIFTPTSRAITLGREGCDINFAHDRFISTRHTRVSVSGDGFQLEDLESRNGTYRRIKQRALLQDGDTLFMGQQIFRVAFGA